jgi:hypothetical protein
MSESYPRERIQPGLLLTGGKRKLPVSLRILPEYLLTGGKVKATIESKDAPWLFAVRGIKEKANP